MTNDCRKWSLARPVTAMVNGIDTAHRFLASLFFDDVRDESGCARDHEYAVQRRGIHSQVGENGADRAVHIDRERFLRAANAFSTARAACMSSGELASFSREFLP